jgi:xylulokinase
MRQMSRYFLGLDSSTQSLKAALVDDRLRLVGELAVKFDADLPRYRTKGGVHVGKDGLTVTSPPVMWVEAMDLLFAKMKKARWPLAKVAAVSASGQQHGSVWMKPGAGEVLNGLNAKRTLKEQLAGIFSLDASPIWMDSSTGKECRALEKALGGPQKVADLTGSRAYERFTGNQIAKVWRRQREVYEGTERIALVSSFVASMMSGDYAPIDWSDGSGMNLLDIRRKRWAKAALDATAPRLAGKLGEPAPSHTAVGPVHRYFVDRYGFSRKCLVVASSGDNPCSVAGLRLQKAGDIAISLGTSDTVFGTLSKPRPSGKEGHIFASPVDPKGYMALVCYKNGALTRELVRDQAAGGSWDAFNKALAATRPGNGGCVGFYVRVPEITPPTLKTGILRFDGRGRQVKAFDPAVDCRAVVEGQFLSMRLHCANLGIYPGSILATGGASANAAIVKVMSDVFGVPVYVGEQPNSASVGAAYRALHGWKCADKGRFVPFAKAMSGAPAFRLAARPDRKAHAVYTGMLGPFGRLEKKMLAKLG